MNSPAPPSPHDPVQHPHQPPSRQPLTPISSPLPPYAPQNNQQQQQQPHASAAMNGVNGGNMAPGAGAGAGPGLPLPTPAGHQAELNYIYGMVEELSRQLADNRRVTEDIVSGLGRVRNRAQNQGLGNDELMAAAAEDLAGEQDNLDAHISYLSESLEKAKFSRDSNASLLSQYATALGLMLKQFHDYKTKHIADVAAWHRSYRAQLDEARQENSRLREHIWEMQAHAGAANESLRAFRRRHDEDEARWRRRVDDTARRQEVRFWRRMAMPDLPDDDPYWSADDDLVDPAEKLRLLELEREAAREQADDSDDPHQQPPLPAGVGGSPMQREDSGEQHVPMPPPRPLSAASSTGSTGQ